MMVQDSGAQPFHLTAWMSGASLVCRLDPVCGPDLVNNTNLARAHLAVWGQGPMKAGPDTAAWYTSVHRPEKGTVILNSLCLTRILASQLHLHMHTHINNNNKPGS